jgi:putative transcriptional regulator
MKEGVVAHYQTCCWIGRWQIRFLLMLLGLSLSNFLTVLPVVFAESRPPVHNIRSALPLSYSLSQAVARSTTTLGKGKFLVASRDLNDPNFAESVILLLDYNENGALGVIINRPTEIALTELLPEVKALRKRKDVAHLGGPVARNMMMILTQTAKPPPKAQMVFADIYLISQQTELDQVFQTNGKKAKVRAYVGYAGWAAGQLDMEVMRGGWLIVPAEAALIFDKALDQVWPELIRRGEAQWTLNDTLDLSPLSLNLEQ